MNRFTAEVKVGLLVIGAMLLLVYMSFRVGGLDFGGDGGYLLELRTDNVAGLAKNGEVLMAGIQVGVIEDIRLEGNKALVVLRIKEGVELPADSSANLKTHGVLGEKYVSITPGTDSVSVRQGGRIGTGPPPGDLDRLVRSLNDVVFDVKKITERLANVLGTQEAQDKMEDIVSGLRDTVVATKDILAENRKNLRSSIENMSVLTETLKAIVDTNRGNIDSTFSNMAGVTSKLNDLVAENRRNLHDAIANLNGVGLKLNTTLETVQSVVRKIDDGDGTMGKLVNNPALYDDLQVTVHDLKRMMAGLNAGEGSLGKLLVDDSAYNELQMTMSNLNDITDKVNAGEGTLGKLVKEDEVHENLNEALAGLNDIIKKTDRYRIQIGYQGQHLFKQGDTKHYFGVKLQPRQDRFYYFALVDDPGGKKYDKVTEINTNSSVSGQETVHTEEKVTEEELKFTALAAKRFSFLTLKGGLMESSGGVGADMDFFSDQFRLSLEAFDFSRDSSRPPPPEVHRQVDILETFSA